VTTVIAFDVDGTLTQGTDSYKARENVRTLLITLARADDTRIVVWSGGGALYAQQVSRALGITPYVDEFLEKNGTLIPDITFDDIPGTMLGKINICI
jgi:phosphoserine phosphatase